MRSLYPIKRPGASATSFHKDVGSIVSSLSSASAELVLSVQLKKRIACVARNVNSVASTIYGASNAYSMGMPELAIELVAISA